jgi:hypothetical protein
MHKEVTTSTTTKKSCCLTGSVGEKVQRLQLRKRAAGEILCDLALDPRILSWTFPSVFPVFNPPLRAIILNATQLATVPFQDATWVAADE